MNSLWTLLDWLLPSLPSVRLSDDLADPELALTRAPTDNGNAYGYTDVAPSSYPPHSLRTNQVVDRPRNHWGPSQKGREKERDSAQSHRTRCDSPEQTRHNLEVENAKLKAKIKQLEEQLKASQKERDSLAVLVPPGLTGSLAPPGFPLKPPEKEAALRSAYEALLSSWNTTNRSLQDRSEEVASLQSFLSKTDDFSGAQLIQTLRDLNSEIVLLAASIVDEFAPSFIRKPQLKKPHDYDLVANALGPALTKLLLRDHSADPTLVQFALQAWEVDCIGRAFDSFCFGAPASVNEALSGIFQHMQLHGELPLLSRPWR